MSNQHYFAMVPGADIPRSQFNRSHGYKTTFDTGLLIPFFVDEALPGDTFNVRAAMFARLATPIKPIMDNMYMDTHFFAVPYRLVFDNFQKLCGEQLDPGDSTDYIFPTMTSPAGGYGEMSLHDYFGLPTKVAGVEHMSLFHRAYNLIWNEWYRDQNLQDRVKVDKDDGPDDPADYVLLRRGKRHDYFTSCLPWPQKGPAIDIPLGTSAPVFTDWNTPTIIQGNNTVGNVREQFQFQRTSPSTQPILTNISATAGPIDTNMYADLSDATAATINQLRQAFQIQKMYEKDARGGTRYIEIIRTHFGVTSPDARLQRPEYLGGGTTRVNINPIAQTASTNETTPQGNLSAIGTAHVSGHGFVKSFTEHTIVMGIVSVRADMNYQQGLSRMFSRSTRFDLYWPSLAHLGEMAVLNKEIYCQGTSVDDEVFGYQENNADYRYKPSQITGLFRSNAAQPLDIWHLAQYWTTKPSLNAEFIQENPPVDRIIAVESEPHWLLDVDMRFKAARPMPVYATPGLIDHF